MKKLILLSVFLSIFLLSFASADHYDTSVSTYYKETTPYGSVTEIKRVSSDDRYYSYKTTSRPYYNSLRSYWHQGPAPKTVYKESISTPYHNYYSSYSHSGYDYGRHYDYGMYGRYDGYHDRYDRYDKYDRYDRYDYDRYDYDRYDRKGYSRSHSYY